MLQCSMVCILGMQPENASAFCCSAANKWYLFKNNAWEAFLPT
jgi:hypothetical protein